MSGQKKSELRDDDMERFVVDYLGEHADLLTRHPDLVERLEIPHDRGKAVSLVEYQLSVLRDNSRALRRQMEDLAKNARDNEELGQRIHRLTLELMRCDGAGEVFATLYQAFLQDFKVDFAALRVFGTPRHESDRGLAEFVGRHALAGDVFDGVLESTRPVCGRLRREQLQVLFSGQAEEVGSGALIPLGGAGRDGVLALCSRDPHRYHPGMGTVFIRQLGEVVTRVLEPYTV